MEEVLPYRLTITCSQTLKSEWQVILEQLCYSTTFYGLQAEKEAAKLARDIRALEAHLEARGNFIEAFEQLQNPPLNGNNVISLVIMWHNAIDMLYSAKGKTLRWLGDVLSFSGGTTTFAWLLFFAEVGYESMCSPNYA